MSSGLLDSPTEKREIASSATESAPKRVALVVCGGERDREFEQTISNLRVLGHRVTVFVDRPGELTAWLSQNGFYYYLVPDTTNLEGNWKDALSRALQQMCVLADLFVRAQFVTTVFRGRPDHTIKLSALARLAGGQRLQLAAPAGLQNEAAAAMQANADTLIRSVIDSAGAGAASATARAPSMAVAWTVAITALTDKDIRRRIFLAAKSAGDRLSGLLFFCLLLPFTIAVFLIRIALGMVTVSKSTVLGQGNRPVNLYSFGPPPFLPAQEGGFLWWLPALINVARGEVALIGPRLVTPELARAPGNESLCYWIKPGLTGWSQIRFRPGMNALDLTRMDELYMATAAPLLDFKVLAATLLGSIIRKA